MGWKVVGGVLCGPWGNSDGVAGTRRTVARLQVKAW
jgi:hypothetical protein